MIPVISVVGRSNSGKTTYLEKLIAVMKQRGYKVAVIKHHHQDFEMDQTGKDTWRHAQAGADVVCLTSPHKMALIKKSEQEVPLNQVIQLIRDVDIIFTEGYKQEKKAKIEIYRQAAGHDPLGVKTELLAVAADTVIYDAIPHFSLEEPAAMADFLEASVLKSK
ncbi:molybdopterin-guanine dinucleotide biosynthesis protein B [Sporomusa acidovorans]|uniref:Molybdopterin-guanine dinucleotide biosynthesis adapter protein n=1 Tax=Sporomusa acidovorans (strain ATCC 49682 / DSM 3132 / Mol) TaxID=1123286 RepID=A0ABZ3J445_SPOA4|nr:molybdopterin-guanine dinucleotide biosynthesis protein B [Sporomusa acidovorans]OZC15532.1 molybdopterin-guanine dinucleotide biosynthesis adapter protein [Sporomusa acidovorans DSM 3132]SDE17272.1 molybdopterin guanine dinucleotide biosynthesis accessory protein MobB [Sporomusa acidovorans]